MTSGVYSSMLSSFSTRQSLLYVLIDPDKCDVSTMVTFVSDADASGVDGFLVGGSLSLVGDLTAYIQTIKSATTRPVVIFPGGVHHISGAADAILFLSLISGRNADQLIGQHVVAAPIVHRLGLEAISTGYMLIESGAVTTAEFMSSSKPIPRHKPEIAVAHALAAEYLGMRTVYLEAGSGASNAVPDEMVAAVSKHLRIPLIVGGGIRTADAAHAKARAGATIVVVGNHFEHSSHRAHLAEFADAVHQATSERIISV